MKNRFHRLWLCVNSQLVHLLLFLFVSSVAQAQPSSQGQGPVRQTYTLPETGNAFYVAPNGDPKKSGKRAEQPTTLAVAIAKAKTGDAIILRGGEYRTGNIIFNQGIVMQPYSDEQPVLKGTKVAKNWKPSGEGSWVTTWTDFFPEAPASWWNRKKNEKLTPLHLFNNDMVFVNGKFLHAAGSKESVNDSSYYIDYSSKQIYIGTDPADKLVEITAYEYALRRVTDDVHKKKSDGKGPIIHGITFTQYARCAIQVEGTDPVGLSDESTYGKDVVGTRLENCSFSFFGRVAAYLMGDSLIIRNCKVSDTSTEGIFVIASSDALLERNIFTRNNIERITGYFPAAVKIFNQSHRVMCRDNRVVNHPFSNGVWYDVGNKDAMFINNWVEGVGDASKPLDANNIFSDNGFFFEISKGAICAGNVFVNCLNGMLVLNSADVRAYQNTFINSTAIFARTPRAPGNDETFGWHSGTGPAVDERQGHVFMNNLLAGDATCNKPLLATWQSDTLCHTLKQPQLKSLDSNVYIKSAAKTSIPLLFWSPGFTSCLQPLMSLQALQNMHPGFSKNSVYIVQEDVTKAFEGFSAGNYRLSPDMKETEIGSFDLPSEVKSLLGLPEDNTDYIGAYPADQ